MVTRVFMIHFQREFTSTVVQPGQSNRMHTLWIAWSLIIRILESGKLKIVYMKLDSESVQIYRYTGTESSE